MRLVFAALFAVSIAAAAPPDMPRFRWDNFTTANGPLPDDHVFNVCVDGNRVWAGTEDGLALYENGKWKVYKPADGLAHRAVLYVAVDKRTGDVWAATMARPEPLFGRPIRQLHPTEQRAAQRCRLRRRGPGRLGLGGDRGRRRRFNTKTSQWEHFNERNTPMYEIWTYAVSAAADKVYYAVWGGGVLEYDVKTARWKDYNDPDGETEMVVLKDQGLIHEITTSVSYAGKGQVLWVATYFGASRYDGRNWKNFLEKDSGLPSNFLNQVKAVDGRSRLVLDRQRSGVLRWRELGRLPPGARYAQARDAGARRRGESDQRRVDTAPAHNYILGVDFQGDDIWVATAKGLSHGIRIKMRQGNSQRSDIKVSYRGGTIMTISEMLEEATMAQHIEKKAITALRGAQRGVSPTPSRAPSRAACGSISATSPCC